MTSESIPIHLPKPEPLVIVISGPSGVGKDSVIRRLKERNLPIHFVITANTRAPRDDERDGVDYFFISKERFFQMIEAGELLEHTQVYTDYKGIPKAQVRQALASGKDVLLRVDVQGAATVHGLCPDAVLIYLAPASEEELVKRLQERKSESGESLRVRIETARHEMEQLKEFDYVVENTQGKLDEAVDTIVCIINAEHHRVHQRKVTL